MNKNVRIELFVIILIFFFFCFCLECVEGIIWGFGIILIEVLKFFFLFEGFFILIIGVIIWGSWGFFFLSIIIGFVVFFFLGVIFELIFGIFNDFFWVVEFKVELDFLWFLRLRMGFWIIWFVDELVLVLLFEGDFEDVFVLRLLGCDVLCLFFEWFDLIDVFLFWMIEIWVEILLREVFIVFIVLVEVVEICRLDLLWLIILNLFLLWLEYFCVLESIFFERVLFFFLLLNKYFLIFV